MPFPVDFEPIGRRIEAEENQTILEAARSLLISEAHTVNAPCGGKGLCGNCKVRIVDGSVSEPTRAEIQTLTPEQLAAGFRLACQTSVLGPLRVEIPPESLSGRQKLQIEGEDIQVAVNPAVKRFAVHVKPPTLSHPYSVWHQALSELQTSYGLDCDTVDAEVLRQMPPKAPVDQIVTVTVRGREIVNAFHSYPAPKPLGVAIDLGTTKIAGFLVDLESGSTLASEAIMNPQIPYGEDVMSRLGYCMAGESNPQRMASLVRESIGDLILGLVSKGAADVQQLEEAVIVGNTAMHHLFLELPVRQLAASPYVPAAAFPIEVEANDLGLPLAPAARVYFPPCIAGFVGGDHVAVILASRIHTTDSPTLGIDIGTNTEIVLSTPTELISCSCASGPAFEGAHIRHGMRAVDGAISEVRWTAEKDRLTYTTIGGARPLGLCGSGVVDAIAELARAGIINSKGLMDRKHPDVRLDAYEKNPEFIIVPEQESGTGHEIVITQKDVVAIQLAKAAIRSGMELLLSAARLTKEEIAQMVVAGAFGSHINIESAICIGLLPDILAERFHSVGNAAGTGARLALVSLSERNMAERIAEVTRYLELTAESQFSATFARELRFPDVRR